MVDVSISACAKIARDDLNGTNLKKRIVEFISECGEDPSDHFNGKIRKLFLKRFSQGVYGSGNQQSLNNGAADFAIGFEIAGENRQFLLFFIIANPFYKPQLRHGQTGFGFFDRV